MRLRVAVASALFALLPGATHHARATDAQPTLRIVTEELPPYNMMRDGRVSGLGTEIVEAVMKQAGISATIELMPWARAYETALTEPNVLIYSIAHTPERDKRFKWVGDIGPPERNCLYALAERHLRIRTLDEARGYRIATVNGDYSEQYLLSQGFVVGTNLSRSNKFESSYAKLKLRRVDLWLIGDLSAPYIARAAGDDPARLLEKVLVIPDVATADSSAAMAFGPRSSDALVARFRDGLQAIRDNGTFDAIQRRWR